MLARDRFVEFTGPPGRGNMSLLLHEDGGRHVGLAVAMKVMASLAAPSPLWWRQNIGHEHDLFQLLASKPAVLGLVILAVTAAGLVLAVCWLRSRELAALAAISLLVSVSAAVSFALIPGQAGAGGLRPPGDVPLIFVMFAAVLVAWLAVALIVVLAGLRLVSDRRGRTAAARTPAPAGQRRAHECLVPLPLRWAALLVVTIVLLGAARQVADYAGAEPSQLHVRTALALIERSLPRQPVIEVAVSSPLKADRYQVLLGLEWALTANGHRPDPTRTRRGHMLPEVAVVIRGRTMTVRIIQ
jgi:hypothetical protein